MRTTLPKLSSLMPGRVSAIYLCLILTILCAAPAQTAGQGPPAEAAAIEEASRLTDQTVTLYKEGKYSEAIPVAERLLTITEKLLGGDHPTVAASLRILAGLHRAKRDFTPAESYYRRALSIVEKVRGPEHKDVVEILANLALIYKEKSDFEQAEPLLLRALAINEKVLGADDPVIAESLNDLALIYKDKADFVRAEPLYRRALAIREKAFGPEHPLVAESVNNLAALYYSKGDLARAEPLLQLALSIREKTLGPDHLEVAWSLNNLAQLFVSKGDLTRAEPLHQRALSIAEKALGPENPLLSKPLNNLAGLYYSKGDFTQAESLFKRALSIRMKAGEGEVVHPSTATLLNNLALIYRQKNNFVFADMYSQRALIIFEKTLGPNHPLVATTLNNLAEIYRETGDVAQAESLYTRALSIVEKAFGPEHPDVARIVNNLAWLRESQGDLVGAESLFKRALPLLEKALGPEHPDVAMLLINLGILYDLKGESALVTQFVTRGSEVTERNLSLILATGSDRQKLAYLGAVSGETNYMVARHTRVPSDSQALRLGLTTILRRKGRALDAMASQVTKLRRRLDSQDRALLDQLLEIQSQLSALVLGGPRGIPLEEHTAAVSALEAKFERLQDAIGQRSEELKRQVQPVTIEQVQRVLPPDAALIELFSYRPYNGKANKALERLGDVRYVAYVLRDKGEPLSVDLGEASSIDADVTRMLIALRCPQTADDIRDCPTIPEVKRLARVVDERVMRPVRRLLGKTRQVFLSPDGTLNLLPFGALVNENGKYLVENCSITYLTSGRDLLRLRAGDESREPPLIVADPDFGENTLPNVAGSESETRPSKLSLDLVEVNFTQLSGTASEARALSALLPGVRVLTQAKATETALKQALGPQLLHVATHGFFLPDQPWEPEELLTALGFDLTGMGNSKAGRRVENLMLRSGLALSGANLPASSDGEDDGILTALEVAGLDLWGTQLVVLSACETGVGQVRNGEGVYGLRRALVLAGSESQVMSLWQVSDVATKDFMLSYYQRLLAGGGRAEALRQAQLEMLQGETRSPDRRVPRRRGGPARKTDYSHPYYWAAFIQSGDWRKMSTMIGVTQK